MDIFLKNIGTAVLGYILFLLIADIEFIFGDSRYLQLYSPVIGGLLGVLTLGFVVLDYSRLSKGRN